MRRAQGRRLLAIVAVLVGLAVVAVVLWGPRGALRSMWVVNKSRPSPESTTESDEDREPPIKQVKTVSPEITVTSEDGKSSFVLRAKESQFEVENGIKAGEMSQVSGELVKNGKTVSSYKAPKGTIDRQRQALVLKGGVEMTAQGFMGSDPAAAPGLEMKADTVTYDQGKGRIEAEGRVTVTSGTMVLGPLPRLWATPDFKKFATPGKFK